MFDQPDHAAERPPLPEEKDECQAGEQHERRSLYRLGHELRPPSLEPAARHDTVLKREDGKQPSIDRQCLQEGHRRLSVERARHPEPADERDGVEKRAQEDHVGETAVGEEQRACNQRGTSSGGLRHRTMGACGRCASRPGLSPRTLFKSASCSGFVAIGRLSRIDQVRAIALSGRPGRRAGVQAGTCGSPVIDAHEAQEDRGGRIGGAERDECPNQRDERCIGSGFTT